MQKKYHLAVYYFPQYHRDPRNDVWHGAGWTEWELVQTARPRFPGHQQPKVPLWGYLDESKPETAERQIDAAADHGIDTFIYDWYWYEDGPFLNGALEKGFLNARNNRRLSFALMWANHDWVDIHPWKYRSPQRVLAEGKVSRAAFERATDHMIATYFQHPSYWKIDGRPYVSFYELDKLVLGLGGIEATKEALQAFDEKVKAAGFPGVHLNAVIWSLPILPGEAATKDPNTFVTTLGFSSVTSYVWIHHVPMNSFPLVEYREVAKVAAKQWRQFSSEFSLPYFPNVTMGWDPSPRACPSDVYENIGYPFTPILANNTPDAFRQALEDAKAYLDESSLSPKVLTINAWNEWTEGSYLEPDTVYGYQYLEAIREVFGE